MYYIPMLGLHPLRQCLYKKEKFNLAMFNINQEIIYILSSSQNELPSASDHDFVACITVGFFFQACLPKDIAPLTWSNYRFVESLQMIRGKMR